MGNLPKNGNLPIEAIRNARYRLKDLLVVEMTPVFPLASLVFYLQTFTVQLIYNGRFYCIYQPNTTYLLSAQDLKNARPRNYCIAIIKESMVCYLIQSMANYILSKSAISIICKTSIFSISEVPFTLCKPYIEIRLSQ